MNKQVTKSIIVNGEVPDLFQTWLDYRNHPRFMENISSATEEGPDTVRWVMEGPMNRKLEWTTKITLLEPNKRIGWKTVEGDLKTSGQVTFTDPAQGQAEVTVTSQMIPPDDLVGKVAAMFEDEDEQWEKDLRNFKAFVENRSRQRIA